MVSNRAPKEITMGPQGEAADNSKRGLLWTLKMIAIFQRGAAID
jgi:hypothetical protein